MEVRAQAAVATENLLVDDSSDGQAVETVREGLPQLDIVATLALIVKSCRREEAHKLRIAGKMKIERQFPSWKIAKRIFTPSIGI